MKALSVKKSGNDRKILCVLLLQDIERYFYLAQSQWENHNQDFHQKIWKCQNICQCPTFHGITNSHFLSNIF